MKLTCVDDTLMSLKNVNLENITKCGCGHQPHSHMLTIQKHTLNISDTSKIQTIKQAHNP